MTLKPVKTYFELSRVVNFLDKINEDNNLNIEKDFISLIALNCSGIKSEDLGTYKCRANHYLKDALKVTELPPVDCLPDITDNVTLQKMCDFIDSSCGQVNFEDNTFREKLDFITHLALESLRQKCIIKGKDKYFTIEQKEFLKEEGYLIIPGVLNDQQVATLSKLILFIAKEEDAAGVSYRYGGESNRLQRVYNLISKHPSFIELLELPLAKEILEHYFDRDNLHHKYVLSSFQSNIVHPGGSAQQLHIDAPSHSGTPLPAWATRLNVNFLLTDWTEDNGSTRLAAASHKMFCSPDPPELSDSELLKVIAPKGSLVLWTGHTWHMSGANNSSEPRYGLFACFAASQLKEVSTEEEHLAVVDKSVMDKLTPEFRFMIGLDRGVKKGSLHRIDFTGTEFEYE